MCGECFKDDRLGRYANIVVMSNKVFFSFTCSDLILCFSYFSRLWIVQERFFGQLCTPNEESSCAEFMQSFGRLPVFDEAHFWLNDYVNKQNCRIWSEANPQVYVETPLHPEKLTVWCALWAGGILLQKR
ncbi:uncharacterized protein TNCV_3838391 [Trichonephila clavipes]|nr:uncharacterized protein TNCV_3838391 [Trichonephila clavipes]